jgi:hypothetical protein
MHLVERYDDVIARTEKLHQFSINGSMTRENWSRDLRRRKGNVLGLKHLGITSFSWKMAYIASPTPTPRLESNNSEKRGETANNLDLE